MVRFAGLEALLAVVRPGSVMRWGAIALLAAACGGRANRHLVGADMDSEGGSGGTAGGASSSGGAAGSPGAGGDTTGVAGSGDAGTGGTVPTACGPLAPRLLRLTFPQIANSVEQLAGAAIADELRAEFGIANARAFPPLAGSAEGSVVNDTVFATSDLIAERAATRMSENMESVTGCSPTGDIACVETYLTEFAALAYRRAIDDTDVQDVLLVTGEAEALGATLTEVFRTGVYSILSSPSFLYRTEFGGADAAEEATLTGDEIANALAYFLSDAPPDAALVAAVTDGSLSTPEGVAREVTRLLEAPEVRDNLSRSLGDLIGREFIELVVVDDPLFTPGVRASAVRELDLFLDDHLFSGSLGELLTSRETRVNAELAALYGIPFPPAGNTPDADGFASVTLPEERAGFLTQMGFLVAAGGPSGTDPPLRRGLRINQLVVCGPMPPSHDEAQEAEVAATGADLEGASQRDRAEYRLATPSCAGCHALFEPYGLALEGFDRFGRGRSTDEVGAAIRDGAMLPSEGGGVTVDGAAEMASALAASGAFTRCLAQAYVRYALSEERPELDVACAVDQAVARAEEAGEASFPEVAAAIAEATALRPRSRSAMRRTP
jgi:hypothetical protein